MKYKVYVLQDQNGKLYKGMTNDIDRRLREHNSGHTVTTSKMKSLRLVYAENHNSFEEARKRELYFKSATGRKFLKKVIMPL